MLRWVLGIFCLLTSLALFAKPTKEDLAKAERIFEQARVHYNLGQYELAVKEFEESYLLSKHPELLLSIGHCYRLLGKNQEAILVYKSFLRERPDDPERDEILGMIEALSTEKKSSATQLTPPTKPATNPMEAPATVTTSDPVSLPNTTPVTQATTQALTSFKLEPPQKSARSLYLSAVSFGLAGVASGGTALGIGLGADEPKTAVRVMALSSDVLLGLAVASLFFGEVRSPHEKTPKILMRASLTSAALSLGIGAAAVYQAKKAGETQNQIDPDLGLASAQRSKAESLARTSSAFLFTAGIALGGSVLTKKRRS
jgi:tetratricopeptide (TPR) repeat protein